MTGIPGTFRLVFTVISINQYSQTPGIILMSAGFRDLFGNRSVETVKVEEKSYAKDNGALHKFGSEQENH